MSMVINLVEDHNIYLCEGGPVYNGGVQPTPVIFLTQWKMMGNSVIHNLPYSDIPHGYKKCKYIESHGTEYIDLGYKNLYSYELKAQLVEAKSTFCIMLANGGSAGQYIGFGADSKWTLGSTFVFNTDNSSPAVVQVTFSASGVEATINNENISRSGSSANSNFKLFTHTTVSTTYNSKAKLWYLKAYDGDTLVHHWIPCLDDNDVPCLYDLVGGQTYYNSGEGTLSYEIEPQPAEIWSCGEYSAVDGKYHILVQPLGGSIVDIVLDEPLRKVNSVADSIEFVNGVATVTRNVGSVDMGDYEYLRSQTNVSGIYRYSATTNLINLKNVPSSQIANALCSKYRVISANDTYTANEGVSINSVQIPKVTIYLEDYKDGSYKDTIKNILQGVEFIYELATPTTEIIQVPQIEEADSYSCVISQGAKAVSWSDFETE